MSATSMLPRDANAMGLDWDIQSHPAADIDTDANGDITITFPNLRTVFYAWLSITGGYLATFVGKTAAAQDVPALNSAVFRVYQTDSHTHVSFIVNAQDTAADKSAFVTIDEGDGTLQAGVFIANAGGATADINIDSGASTAAAFDAVANGTNLGIGYSAAIGRK